MDQDAKPSESFRNATLPLNSTADREHQTPRDTHDRLPEPNGGQRRLEPPRAGDAGPMVPIRSCRSGSPRRIPLRRAIETDNIRISLDCDRDRVPGVVAADKPQPPFRHRTIACRLGWRRHHRPYRPDIDGNASDASKSPARAAFSLALTRSDDRNTSRRLLAVRAARPSQASQGRSGAQPALMVAA
jgi:hypothetical protein